MRLTEEHLGLCDACLQTDAEPVSAGCVGFSDSAYAIRAPWLGAGHRGLVAPERFYNRLTLSLSRRKRARYPSLSANASRPLVTPRLPANGRRTIWDNPNCTVDAGKTPG